VFEGGLAPTFSFVGEGRAVEIEALLRPVVEAEGLELYDVTRGREGGRAVLRVTVDAPGGVDIETLTRLTETVARRLDAEGEERASYDLQLSSPGLERSLQRPEHFRRAIGERVRMKLRSATTDPSARTGTVVAVDDEAVTLAVGGGEVRVPHADIASARTVVDWGAEMKRSNA
jgi:ribosome maturation factor RimP